jgi:hypothetical protein
MDFGAVSKSKKIKVSSTVGPPTSPPKTVDPIELVKRALEPYSSKVDGMLEAANDWSIDSPETLKTSVEMAGQAKRLGKGIEIIRKDSVGPLNDVVKKINGLCKDFTDRLGMIEKALIGKARQYQASQELERRKREEEARKILLEAQAKLDAEAKKAGVEPIKIETAPVVEAPKNVRTEEGTLFNREVWKFEVVRSEDVPREYLIIDEKAISQAVKNGIREIPGVRIYPETTVGLRT